MIYKYAYLSVYSFTQASTRPSVTPCVSVVACMGLMECPKQKPRWDLMVRQTYSTTHIKINTQSEVLTLSAASSFFKYSVLSMNIQHGQDLHCKDGSSPWETTRRKWREKEGEESMERAWREHGESRYQESRKPVDNIIFQ